MAGGRWQESHEEPEWESRARRCISTGGCTSRRREKGKAKKTKQKTNKKSAFSQNFGAHL